MVRSVSRYGSVKVKYLAKRDLNPNFVGGKSDVSDRRERRDGDHGGHGGHDGDRRGGGDRGGDRRGGGGGGRSQAWRWRWRSQRLVAAVVVADNCNGQHGLSQMKSEIFRIFENNSRCYNQKEQNTGKRQKGRIRESG